MLYRWTTQPVVVVVVVVVVAVVVAASSSSDVDKGWSLSASTAAVSESTKSQLLTTIDNALEGFLSKVTCERNLRE